MITHKSIVIVGFVATLELVTWHHAIAAGFLQDLTQMKVTRHPSNRCGDAGFGQICKWSMPGGGYFTEDQIKQIQQMQDQNVEALKKQLSK